METYEHSHEMIPPGESNFYTAFSLRVFSFFSD